MTETRAAEAWASSVDTAVSSTKYHSRSTGWAGERASSRLKKELLQARTAKAFISQFRAPFRVRIFICWQSSKLLSLSVARVNEPFYTWIFKKWIRDKPLYQKLAYLYTGADWQARLIAASYRETQIREFGSSGKLISLLERFNETSRGCLRGSDRGCRVYIPEISLYTRTNPRIFNLMVIRPVIQYCGLHYTT